MKALINGKLILPHEVLENTLVLFEKKIIAIIKQDNINKEWEIYDAKGAYVAPGFINMHVHGCAGTDTMDGTASALQTISQALPSTGVTSFLPTTMTYDWPTIDRALDNIKSCQSQVTGAKILGANLEGPFLSPLYTGAQNAFHLSLADFTKIAPYQNIIKILTLAPETAPSIDFIQSCKNAGIIVSLGHSAATYEQAVTALSAGASHFTHLFNAMSPLHHRKPGLVGAALTSDAYVELICDNIHLHPLLLNLVYKQKDRSKIILITDSMRAALLGNGESELGGQKVFVQNGKATLKDGTLAGSVLTMNKAVQNFAEATNAPLWEVVAMASLNPATELGLGASLGSLAPGKGADLTLFANDFNILQTFVDGKCVYK